jgi:hypothetical protein
VFNKLAILLRFALIPLFSKYFTKVILEKLEVIPVSTSFIEIALLVTLEKPFKNKLLLFADIYSTILKIKW